MGQQQPPYDYEHNDRPDMDRTQPSPMRPPRQLDWRPPEYQSDGEGAPPGDIPPPVRRVQRPVARRRRPPTEGAPAWLVWTAVFIMGAVILVLAVLFFSRHQSSQPELTVTVAVVTPTATLPPRPTATVLQAETQAPEATAEQAPAPTAPLPDVIGIGGYVRVAAPAGLSFRQTASPDGALVQVLDGGSVLEVIGGPREAGGYTWWQLRKLDDGQEGWSAQGSGADVFLAPTSAP